jgi:hypothetical protein
MRPTQEQWSHKCGMYYDRGDEVKDVELMDKSTTNIFYENTLYSNVEIYMYINEKWDGKVEDTVNVNIFAYSYMTVSDLGIRIRTCREDKSITRIIVMYKYFKISVYRNTTNSMVNNIRTFVEDVYEFFSKNIINDTNVALFQTKFLVKTKFLFNLPVLYAVCRKLKLL